MGTIPVGQCASCNEDDELGPSRFGDNSDRFGGVTIDTGACCTPRGADMRDMLDHQLLQFCRSGDLRGIEAALLRGADIETRRPLVIAPSAIGHKRTVSEDIGLTPLMLTAMGGDEACVKRLLVARASVSAIDEDAWTPLHFAAKEAAIGACMQLLSFGADPDKLNSDQMTPLDVARKEDPDFAAKLLLAQQRQAEVDQIKGIAERPSRKVITDTWLAPPSMSRSHENQSSIGIPGWQDAADSQQRAAYSAMSPRQTDGRCFEEIKDVKCVDDRSLPQDQDIAERFAFGAG